VGDDCVPKEVGCGAAEGVPAAAAGAGVGALDVVPVIAAPRGRGAQQTSHAQVCPVHDITVSNHPPEMCHFARNVMLPPREGGARRTAPPHLRSGAVIHVLVPPSTTPPRCRGQGHLSGAASPCGGRGIFDAIPGVVTSHLGQLRRRSRGPASRASRASGRPAGRPAGINHARAPARMHTRAWVRASSQGRDRLRRLGHCC